MKLHSVLSLLFAVLSLVCGAAVTKADPVMLPISGGYDTTFSVGNCLNPECTRIQSPIDGKGTISLNGTTYSNVVVAIDQIFDTTTGAITGTATFTLPNGDRLLTTHTG